MEEIEKRLIYKGKMIAVWETDSHFSIILTLGWEKQFVDDTNICISYVTILNKDKEKFKKEMKEMLDELYVIKFQRLVAG